MLLYTHLVWGLALEPFFGPDGWQDPLLVQTRQSGSAAWSLWWHVPPTALWTAHYVSLAILVLFTLGFWTRVTSILAWVVTVSYVNRAPMAGFGLDQINTLIVFYLCLAPSGAALSIDRWWQRLRQSGHARRTGTAPVLSPPSPSVAAGLATRLLQVHVAVLYLFAGLAKLKGETWWTGEAIWLGAANLEYQSGSLVWLAWHPYLVNFLTHATVAWELTFIVLVWKPAFRPFVLLGGTLLHLGIGLFLGMWTFGLVMLLTYVSFIPPTVFSRLAALLFARVPAVQVTDVRHPVTSTCVALLLGLSLPGCSGPPAETAPVLLERGQLYIAREQFDRAIETLTRAHDLAPTDPQILYERGLAHERLGQAEPALSDYGAAIALRPDFVQAHNNRAAVHARLRQFEAAIAGFTRAIELDPQDSLARRNRGLAYHDLRRFDEARDDLRHAIELEPASPEPWYLLGNVCLDAGQWPQAVECYSAALKLNPLHAPSWANRAQAHDRLGHEAEARRDRARADEIAPPLVPEEIPLTTSPAPTAP